MVGTWGLEPQTSTVSILRSTPKTPLLVLFLQLKEGRANGHLAGAIGALTSVIFMPPRQISILGMVSSSSSGKELA